MKKYPKIVQCDKRGQIVIPKDIRQELDIDEGSAFWMFSISDEGILLKKVPEQEISEKVPEQEISENTPIVRKIKEKSDKLDIPKEKIDKAVKEYKRKPKGRLEEV
jgi:AbrB family looped-hinge helix DNA binding protein